MNDFLKGISQIYKAFHLGGKGKYRKITEDVCSIFSAASCAIYVRKRNESSFTLFEHFPQEKDIPIHFSQKEFSDSNFLVNPIHSEGKVLFGYLVSGPVINPTEIQKAFLSIICEVLAREIDRELVSTLFTEMTKQIPLSLDEKEFHDRLVRMVARAAGVPFAALRRYRQDQAVEKMECLAVYAQDNKRDDSLNESLVFNKGTDIFDAFHETMIREPISCTVINDPDSSILKELTSHPPFQDVKTIIIAPLLVAGKQLGTVSFGILYETEFSRLELTSFLAIANWAGSALSNYEDSRAYAEIEKVRFQEFKNETQVEIIAGLRHSAKNNLEAAIGWLKAGINEFKKTDTSSQKKTQEVQDLLFKTQESLTMGVKDINNMTTLARLKIWQAKKEIIYDLVVQAQLFVKYGLDKNDIIVTLEISPKLEAFVDGAQIVYALVNLFINAIEAFERKLTKSKRLIQIKAKLIEKPKKDNDIEILFIDNAGGVRDKFNRPLDNPQIVWDIGVTTSNNGSGMGLPYVRRVFQKQHCGNAHFQTDKIGTKFEIVFPQSPKLITDNGAIIDC